MGLSLCFLGDRTTLATANGTQCCQLICILIGSAVHIQTCNKVCHWIRSRLERQKNTIQISDKYVYMLKTVLFTFTSCYHCVSVGE